MKLKVRGTSLAPNTWSQSMTQSATSASGAFTKSVVALAVAMAAVTSMPAFAESNFQTGAGALTATARVDVQITVPRILYLQVGTGTVAADNPAIDLVTFAPTGAQIAAGTAGIAATGTSGQLNAKLVGNGGPITLTATTAGALTTAIATETISWSQIATSTSVAGFPHPALVDGAAGTASSYPSKVNNLSATWTYAFNAPTLVPPAAGVYGGAGVRNGRIVYTASMP